jgi:hypothetical protein
MLSLYFTKVKFCTAKKEKFTSCSLHFSHRAYATSSLAEKRKKRQARITCEKKAYRFKYKPFTRIIRADQLSRG